MGPYNFFSQAFISLFFPLFIDSDLNESIGFQQPHNFSTEICH